MLLNNKVYNIVFIFQQCPSAHMTRCHTLHHRHKIHLTDTNRLIYGKHMAHNKQNCNKSYLDNSTQVGS